MESIKQAKTRIYKWLPGVSAVLAFVSCKGLAIIVAIYPLVGFTVVISPNLQAAAISIFAALTLVFMFVACRDHRDSKGLLTLTAMGAVLVIGTIYIAYNPMVETVGLIVLLGSVVWGWRIGRKVNKLDSVVVSKKEMPIINQGSQMVG